MAARHAAPRGAEPAARRGPHAGLNAVGPRGGAVRQLPLQRGQDEAVRGLTQPYKTSDGAFQ